MDVGSARFSELFGSFPTPIAIVTATDGDGEPFGFTSNAVCAVSAANPSLLISVGKGSRTLPAIMSSQAFAVNFLAASGQVASQVFASKATDKFANLEWRPSAIAKGAPLLIDIALSYAECKVENAIEVGDHWLFIARVEGTAVFPREPLLYRRGGYGFWSPQDIDAAELSAVR
ncbi:flavin reductase family protein [Streptomyces sp. NBC_01092]|uniref:flavin reductase family protein n=1 Tax=Streptomyces sp. NBC_01092 TaxID=2903748 RepID=UPI00386F7152|nr:flavin reductase family protein [Streptomyces sp. NBC_01092]